MKLARKLLALNLALLLVFSAFSPTAMAAPIAIREGYGTSFSTPNPDGYRFTPTKTGLYRFHVWSSDRASCCDLIVYGQTSNRPLSAISHSNYSMTSGFYTLPLQGGMSYIIKCRNGSSSGYGLGVEKLDVPILKPAYTRIEFSPTVWQYTSSKAGWYTFGTRTRGVMGLYDSDIEILEKAGVDNIDSSYSSAGLSMYLKSGKTYYLDFAPESTPADLKVLPSSFPELTAEQSVSFYTAGGPNYTTFTPAVTGTYEITAKDRYGSERLNGLTIYSSTQRELKSVGYEKIEAASLDTNYSFTAGTT